MVYPLCHRAVAFPDAPTYMTSKSLFDGLLPSLGSSGSREYAGTEDLNQLRQMLLLHWAKHCSSVCAKCSLFDEKKFCLLWP